MARAKRTISCSVDRSCVVILEPSGEEFLLRAGKVMEIAGEVEEGHSIDVEEHGNHFVVHVPQSGGVSLFVGGRPAERPSSLEDIIELEIAKLPPDETGFCFTDEFIAQIQTFALEEVSPVAPGGKLGVFEIAAQTSMELFKLRPQLETHCKLVAAVCRRVLAVGAIFVQTPPSEFGRNLWSAAKSDSHLGAEPRSIRRLLASSCLYPPSIADEVHLWSNQRDPEVRSKHEEQADIEE